MGVLDYIIFGTFISYLVKEAFTKFNKTESINSYAIGNRTFSTFALASTITATWVSGSGFVLDLKEFHEDGFKYFLVSCGMCLNLIIMARYLVPRMQNFLGKTSVASIIGNEYGEIARNITAILGTLTSCGGIAIQFKIMGNVIYYLIWGIEKTTDLNLYCSILIGGIITTAYTCSGGIRSVVRTDIIQAMCFTIALIIATTIFNTKINILNTYNHISEASLQKFYPNSILSLTGRELLDQILLLGYFFIPGLKPQVIQRVSMGKNLEQVQKSYFWSGIALFFVLFFSCWLSYLMLITNPQISGEDLLPFLINSYEIPGTKAIVVIGVIAMCMSTADSNLNISSVLLANDTYLSRRLNPIDKILKARYITILIGTASIFLALKKTDLLELILLSASFYLPIISTPLLGLIFKWKTSPRVCVSVMITCLLFVIIFKFIFVIDIDVNVIGMILNAILLIIGHYIVEKWELLRCFGIRSKLKN